MYNPFIQEDEISVARLAIFIALVCCIDAGYQAASLAFKKDRNARYVYRERIDLERKVLHDNLWPTFAIFFFNAFVYNADDFKSGNALLIFSALFGIFSLLPIKFGAGVGTDIGFKLRPRETTLNNPTQLELRIGAMLQR